MFVYICRCFTMEKLYTVSEAADIFNVSRTTVQRWLDKGHIKYVQIGSGWRRIPDSEISKLMGELKT